MGRANQPWSLVFMYGQYMNSYDMKFRCPDALCTGMAILDGYKFIINGRGAAAIVPERESKVQGVIWRVTRYGESDLDKTMGCIPDNPEKSRCDKFLLPMRTSAGMSLRAFVYLEKDITPGKPDQRYMQKLISGAVEHALDKNYIDRVLRAYKEKPKRESFTTY